MNRNYGDAQLHIPRSKKRRRNDESPQNAPNTGKYDIFEKLLLEQYDQLLARLAYSAPARGPYRKKLSFFTGEGKVACATWGIKTPEDLEKKGFYFRDNIKRCISLAYKDITDKEGNNLFFRLREAFVARDLSGLRSEMKFCFVYHMVGKEKGSEIDTKNQRRLADLKFPTEWFPATRAIQRTIHLHVGPTNSGKTYHALKRLEAAQSGIYAGPLRLLAHEVYTRLNAKGKLCALVTGEEKRVPEGMKHYMSSCTVEMVSLNTKVDVAVIDEIQMLGDSERGWAWTQTFLGVQAKEVHLCGELRTIDLVTDLCATMGEKLVVHRYERLSPLKMMPRSLDRKLHSLEKGDAVILFSRIAIHAMKQKIERLTGRRCAMIYGSLPPETRAQQANFFNDPNNDYDFLVASDAVGMGLNLSIRRIIFDSTSKFDGMSWGTLPISEIKQIAGRAGRYKTARDAVQEGPVDVTDGQPVDVQLASAPPPSNNVGWVSTIEEFDFPIVCDAMEGNAKPLKSAGILPPAHIISQFASYFPSDTPFSFILMRLNDMAALNPRFHLCHLTDQLGISDIIQPFNLTVEDRINFMSAPVSLRDKGFIDFVADLARCVAESSNGHLLDLKSLKLELLDKDKSTYPGGESAYLRVIETLHKQITLYLWLSYRFNGVFISQPLAFHVKKIAEKKIEELLESVNWSEKERHPRVAILEKHFAKEKQLSEFRTENTKDGETVKNNVEGIGSEVMSNDAGGAGEHADDFEDSPASDAGVPITPEDKQRVVNHGPLWNHVPQQQPPAHILGTEKGQDAEIPKL
jgi:ATP-dependent RNA helicase SUPV3L1/SUV3